MLKYILPLCLLATPCFADDVTTALQFSGTSSFAINNSGPASIAISGGNPTHALVTIKPSGEILYSDDYRPDEAAKIFWNAVGFEAKARNCK